MQNKTKGETMIELDDNASEIAYKLKQLMR